VTPPDIVALSVGRGGPSDPAADVRVVRLGFYPGLPSSEILHIAILGAEAIL
jgi:hypothetical protein